MAKIKVATKNTSKVVIKPVSVSSTYKLRVRHVRRIRWTNAAQVLGLTLAEYITRATDELSRRVETTEVISETGERETGYRGVDRPYPHENT